MKEKILNYPFSFILITAIWIICMIPVPETPLNDVCFIDKWTHFVMYASLTVTIWWEYISRHRKSSQFKMKRLLIGGILCPIAMGCLIELAQAYFTTCRSGDWFDAVCNAIGVILGGFIGYLIKVVRYKKKRHVSQHSAQF